MSLKTKMSGKPFVLSIRVCGKENSLFCKCHDDAGRVRCDQNKSVVGRAPASCSYIQAVYCHFRIKVTSASAMENNIMTAKHMTSICYDQAQLLFREMYEKCWKIIRFSKH